MTASGRFLPVQIGEIHTNKSLHTQLPSTQSLTHSSPTYTH